jgi:hypothetical protein
MYAIDVIFKNGSKLEGLIWSWEPEHGWFKALDESNGKIKTYQLKDVKEGKFYEDRIRKTSKSYDFLEKAAEDGYRI